MRVRDKLTGSTFIAELDLRRLSNQHADFVLLLHGDHGKEAAMGRVAASLGCELVEWTRKELAALVLAGFQMPHGKRRHLSLPQVNSLLRIAKRRLPNPKPKPKVSKTQSPPPGSKRRGQLGHAHPPGPNSVLRGNLHVAIPGGVRHRDNSNPRQSSRSTMRRTTTALVNS